MRRLPRDHRSHGARAREFDPIGRWRDTGCRSADRREHDAAGGIPISGPTRIARRAAARPELFVPTFTQKLMVYALGRRLEAEDMPTLRRIVREAASDD